MVSPKQKAVIQVRVQLINQAQHIVNDCKQLSTAFFKTSDIDKQKEIMWSYIHKREVLRDIRKELGEMRANDHERTNL